MEAFFNSLSPVQKVFLFCAVLGGALFIVRTILSLVGMGDHDVDGGDFDVSETHADADSSFRLFSLHGLTGFFMMFGLVGLGLSRQFWVPDIVAGVAGILAGLATTWVIGKLFQSMGKLQSDGTLRMSDAMGQQGKVYLTIPASGTGQVQVAFQGRVMMYDAVSADKKTIKTGEPVVVIDIVGGNTLVVEKMQ
jgi:membrane protein implicated in regulation of membrane protease activity